MESISTGGWNLLT